jgi:hypothetical protein
VIGATPACSPTSRIVSEALFRVTGRTPAG